MTWGLCATPWAQWIRSHCVLAISTHSDGKLVPGTGRSTQSKWTMFEAPSVPRSEGLMISFRVARETRRAGISRPLNGLWPMADQSESVPIMVFLSPWQSIHGRCRMVLFCDTAWNAGFSYKWNFEGSWKWSLDCHQVDLYSRIQFMRRIGPGRTSSRWVWASKSPRADVSLQFYVFWMRWSLFFQTIYWDR